MASAAQGVGLVAVGGTSRVIPAEVLGRRLGESEALGELTRWCRWLAQAADDDGLAAVLADQQTALRTQLEELTTLAKSIGPDVAQAAIQFAMSAVAGTVPQLRWVAAVLVERHELVAAWLDRSDAAAARFHRDLADRLRSALA